MRPRLYLTALLTGALLLPATSAAQPTAKIAVYKAKTVGKKRLAKKRRKARCYRKGGYWRRGRCVPWFPPADPEPATELNVVEVISPAALLCNSAELECGEAIAVATCPSLAYVATGGGISSHVNAIEDATILQSSQRLQHEWAVVVKTNQHATGGEDDPIRYQAFTATAYCVLGY